MTPTTSPLSPRRTKPRAHSLWTNSTTTAITTHEPPSTTINEEEEKKRMDEETDVYPRKRIKKPSRQTDEMDTTMADDSHIDQTIVGPRHVLSSSQRCDANSLSIIFSFLKSREFSSALRVNHLWHSTAGMNTAWPPFNLESFIHQLESENYSGAGQRRLVLGSPKQLTNALNHPMMKKANDIILSSSRLPARLAEFSHLTALNVTLTSGVDTADFTRAMKDRLCVLIISAPWTHLRMFSTLHELSTLRVLVTDFPIESSQLEQLTQLEYLHVGHSYFCLPTNIRSIRLLSIYHCLRHFSLEWSVDPDIRYYRVNGTERILQWPQDPQRESVIPEPDADCLELLRDDWRRAVPDAVEPVSVPPAHFISFGLSGAYVDSVPLHDLVRLSCTTSSVGPFSDEMDEDELSVGLSRLNELRLCIHDIDFVWWEPIPAEVNLPGLQHSTALKVLHLSSPGMNKGDMSHMKIKPQYWPQLEELSVAYPAVIDNNCIQSLSVCQHLRRLDLSNRPIVDLDMIAPMLSKLPEFQILELTVWPPEPRYRCYGNFIPAAKPFILPPSFMQHVSHSTTWSSLHLHLSDDYLTDSSRFKKSWSIEPTNHTLREGGAVDSLTSKRFCLQVHPPGGGVDRIYRVMTDLVANQQSWCEI